MCSGEASGTARGQASTASWNLSVEISGSCGPCNRFPLTVSLDLRLPYCKMEPTLTDVCFCKKSSQIFEKSRVLSGRISVYGTEGHRSLLPGSVRGLRCGLRGQARWGLAWRGRSGTVPARTKCASHRVCRWLSPCLLPSHLLGLQVPGVLEAVL